MLWLNILFIVVSIALVAAVLVQSSSAGLGAALGGGTEGFHVRRGSEKRIFQVTIVLSILFIALAAAHIFLG